MLQFTSYFAFCAVVVLYVYSIQQSSSPSASYRVYLDAATRCQRQIAEFAEKESLAHRYCLVLEELRLETVRQSEGIQESANGAPTHFSTTYGRLCVPPRGDADSNAVLHGDGTFEQFTLVDDAATALDASPSSFLADMTSWGNFDSMASLSIHSGFPVYHVPVELVF